MRDTREAESDISENIDEQERVVQIGPGDGVAPGGLGSSNLIVLAGVPETDFPLTDAASFRGSTGIPHSDYPGNIRRVIQVPLNHCADSGAVQYREMPQEVHGKHPHRWKAIIGFLRPARYALARR